MKKSVRTQAESYNTEHRKKKSWLKVVTALGAIVVFCTTYALILPAITMENLTCGLEEHTHGEECYAEVPAQVLTCEQQEHTHTEDCYALTCGLEEGEEHTHSESCYTLACEKAEHTHTDACKDAPLKEQSPYICGKEEHVHSEECYFEDGTLKCTLEAHTHDEGCTVGGGAETEQTWTADFADVELGESFAENIHRIAQTQLGYAEHDITTEDGVKSGYTRYGDWMGEPFADWNVPFVLFCGNYAKVPDFGTGMSAEELFDCMRRGVRFHAYGEDTYRPKPGDLVIADGRIGIPTEFVLDESYTVIEGDVDGTVQKVTYCPENCGELGFFNMGNEVSLEPEADEEAVSLMPDWTTGSMLLQSAGLQAGNPTAESNEQVGANFMTKTINWTEENGYELTLEGWSETSTSPLDIVLLFDVSGSMRYSIDIGGAPKYLGHYSTSDTAILNELDKSGTYYLYGSFADRNRGIMQYRDGEWKFQDRDDTGWQPIAKVMRPNRRVFPNRYSPTKNGCPK